MCVSVCERLAGVSEWVCVDMSGCEWLAGECECVCECV